MRWYREALLLVVVVAACDGGSNAPADAAADARADASGPPPIAPQLTSFVASPSQLSPGVATDVTWTWTYAGAPSP